MNPTVGTQMYTWLQYYRDQGKDLMENLDAALGMIADAGLEAVEHGVQNDQDAAVWAKLLDKHKLKMPSVYSGGTLHIAEWRKSADRVMGMARIGKGLGAKTLSLNPDPLPRPANRNKSDAELRRQAEAVSFLAKSLKDEGMTLAYHTHDPEMRAAAREFHHTLLATQGAGAKLCLDAHWVFRGAENSQVALEDVVTLYGDRIAVMHLRQSKDGVWTEHLSAGDVDYTPIAPSSRPSTSKARSTSRPPPNRARRGRCRSSSPTARAARG